MLKSQIKRYWLASYAAHRPSVVPAAVVGRVNISPSEAQDVSVVTIIDRTRPIAATAARIVQRATTDAAGPHKIKRLCN